MRNNIPLPAPVVFLLERLEQCGYEAYVVGGCVRDSLLGRIPHDWDLTTNALPDETMRCFVDCKTISTGRKHGTVGIVFEGCCYEITTYRIDGSYGDHRRPDRVDFSPNLGADLMRRDFTINALAYHPAQGVIDEHGGIQDLSLGRIACVGDPQRRFDEDALRILRAARFASVLGFTIEESTGKAMLSQRELLRHISRERVTAELRQALVGIGAHLVFARQAFAQVLTAAVPELEPLLDSSGGPGRWELAMNGLEKAEPSVVVRLSVLFSFVDASGERPGGRSRRAAAQVAAALHRLKFDKATAARVTLLVRCHHFAIPPSAPKVCRWLNRLGKEALRQLLQLQLALDKDGEREGAITKTERILDEMIRTGQCWSLDQLAVNGKDLLERGCPAGPQMGALLRHLLGLVISGDSPNQRQALLQAADVYLERSRSSME